MFGKPQYSLPPNCTDRLQPLDISVNKAAKNFLRSEFQNWYADEVAKQLSDEQDTTVDLSTPRMKCLGGQKLFNYIYRRDATVTF